MTALAVIEHFDVFKHCRLGLFVCLKVLQRDSFGLSCVQEALGHRVVPTVALPAHTGLHTMLAPALPVAVRTILPPTVRMHHESRGGLPLIDGHCSRLVHSLCPPMVGHRPPDDCPRAEIQYHGEIQPAFAGGEGGNIPNVESLGCVHCQRPVELMWCHRLGLPCGRRRFACAPRCAA